MGVAAAGPGRTATHFTLFVLEKSSGNFSSEVEPSKFGPRQCGQSAALIDIELQKVRSAMKANVTSGFISDVFDGVESVAIRYD